MFIRFAFLVLCVVSLSACSTTPDRYAFWRNDAPVSTGHKPNLGDVPAPPATADAKADMDAMKARLQQDRANAYLVAQGVVPMDAVETPTVASDDLAPLAQVAAAPAPTNDAYGQMPVSSGDVQYNYAPSGETYVYGYSPVQINKQVMYQQQANELMASNSSVSIDFSALDGGSTVTAFNTPLSVSGEPLVYFNHGSARLGVGDKKRLADVAQHLKSQLGSLMIIGHASARTGISDPVASQSVNLEMSAKRATNVLRELSRHGIDADRVRVTALGDSAPNQSPAKPAGEAGDRRVELLFD